MPNGTYGGVRGEETKVGQKTFVSRPTRLCPDRIHRSNRNHPGTIGVCRTCFSVILYMLKLNEILIHLTFFV